MAICTGQVCYGTPGSIASMALSASDQVKHPRKRKAIYCSNRPRLGAMKTINEVCIQADNATELSTLISLHQELLLDKKKYALVELIFMLEHILNAVKAMAGQDVIEFRNGFTLLLGKGDEEDQSH